ncbi:MAG: hypothetical protein AAF569_04490 [Pseudomonadota bacterium]
MLIEGDEIEIWGVETYAFIKYLYAGLFILVALNLVFSFSPDKGSAYHQEVKAYQERIEYLQAQVTNAEDITDRQYSEHLEELRELRENLRSIRQTAPSGLLAFLGILGFAGFSHFCICVYLYLMEGIRLGDVLRSHAGFLWMNQVVYFIISLIMIPILMFIPVISPILVGLFVASQAFFVTCGLLLYQADELVTVESYKQKVFELTNTAKAKIKGLKKE